MSMKAFPMLLVSLLLATAAACGTDDGPPSSGEPHKVTVRDPHLAFSLDAPGGVMRPTRDGDQEDRAAATGCPLIVYRLRDEPNLRAEAARRDCQVPVHSPPPGNGRHGVYENLTDLDPGLRGDGTLLRTRLGTAEVLSQRYFECTNSCQNYQEPIAFVMLRDPVDKDFPVLVLRSDHEVISSTDFTRIVKSLRPPA